MNKPKTLFYDIETSLLVNHCFGLGKTVLRHGSLLPGYFSRTHIITLTYKWSDSDEVVTLDWGKTEEDEKTMIELFDKEVQKADQVIGKNNRRFDDKLINAARLWFDLPGNPEWIRYNDDLEAQMRRYFKLPSQSLDYISHQLGLGGKDTMQFSDWVDLSYLRMAQLAPESKSLIKVLTGQSMTTCLKNGKEALHKMTVYNQKDVTDTENLWNYCKKHFEPKFNTANLNEAMVCKICGSNNIRKNGTRYSGKTRYQSFYCNNHGGYAGRATISKHGKLGTIG